METLVEEVRQWNSPSVGAFLLWQFTSGYCESHRSGDAPVALLHFIAVPLLTSTRLITPISDKRKGLQSYIRSFEDLKESDLLMSIQDRIKQERSYTMAAIDIAVSAGLLVWDTDAGKLHPREDMRQARRGKALKAQFVKDGKKAAILGRWFSEHHIATIATYLKVVL